MQNAFEFVSVTSILIVAAVGTYVVGLLCRDQLYIRGLILVGSICYVLYYWLVPAGPLWDAMVGAVLIGAASLQGALKILWSRAMISAPKDTRHVLESLGEIEPGLFRRLLRSGARIEIETYTILTVEGERPDSLWLLLNGDITLERRGQMPTVISGPCFVGEIAWLTGGPASATVTIHSKCDVVQWKHEQLRSLFRYNHRIELALEALIAQDLARKLSKSAPILGAAGTA